jgi:serine/threonine protein phosphatase PrpC
VPGADAGDPGDADESAGVAEVAEGDAGTEAAGAAGADTNETAGAGDEAGDDVDAPPAIVGPCPSCGEDLVAEARFCEACGAPVSAVDAAGDSTAGGATGDGGSTSGPTTAEMPAVGATEACAQCGSPVDEDGYCTSCGLRAIEPAAVEDRGSYAFATHRGRRHPRNEDSGALAATAEGWPVLVVSDGVSASPNPHLASATAVAAVVNRLDGQPFGGPDDLRAAVLDAHEAARAVSADGDPLWVSDGTHPACTIVVAVATGDEVHMANVGDARGYLVTRADTWTPAQMTNDDSLAALAVRQGVAPATALTLPGGHAITAWLGADAPTPEVHLATRPAAPTDLMLVCSDGLWNYAPTDDELGAQLDAAVPAPPAPPGAAAACEALVSWAVDQGGSDNICVALAPCASVDTAGVAPATPAPAVAAAATAAAAAVPDGPPETVPREQEEQAP